MYYTNREGVRTGFVRALRMAFETNSDFLYKTNPLDPSQPADDCGIYIYDAFPWKKIGYPAIIVSLGPGDPLMRTMGGEHWGDNKSTFIGQDNQTFQNVDSEFFGGGMQTDVIITVYARSSVQRSRIMDWVDMYLRFFFPHKFQQQGVTVQTMSHGGERQELVGNDPVFSDTLTVSVYSEFQTTVSTQLAGTIDGICLMGVFTLMLDGSTSIGIPDPTNG